MEKDRTPFTYLIGWSSLDRWYYGVHWRKKCNPTDLWTKYFTSSKIVKAFRKKYGEPDVIQVRKVFETSADARCHEMVVLRRIKVVDNPRWLNSTDHRQHSLPIMIRLNNHIRNRFKGKTYEEIYGEEKARELKESRSQTNKWRKGKTFEEMYGEERAKELKENLSERTRGNTWANNSKGWSWAKGKSLTCPRCNKTGSHANMKRWHFNNCGKERPKPKNFEQFMKCHEIIHQKVQCDLCDRMISRNGMTMHRKKCERG
jgi:hypothetical protein